MPTDETITATDFKAKCLEILDRISQHQIDKVVITKRGKVVAVLGPPAVDADSVENIHGFLAGTVVVPPHVDLTQPLIDEPFLAANGRLHG